jgi:hypothetical protein
MRSSSAYLWTVESVNRTAGSVGTIYITDIMFLRFYFKYLIGDVK